MVLEIYQKPENNTKKKRLCITNNLFFLNHSPLNDLIIDRVTIIATVANPKNNNNFVKFSHNTYGSLIKTHPAKNKIVATTIVGFIPTSLLF